MRTGGHINGADHKRGHSLLTASSGTKILAEKDFIVAVSQLEEPLNMVFIISPHLAVGFSTNPEICFPRLLQRIRVGTQHLPRLNLRGVEMTVTIKYFLNKRLHVKTLELNTETVKSALVLSARAQSPCKSPGTVHLVSA